MHTIEEGNRPRPIAANSLSELAERVAEDRRKNPEPEPKPKGFKYSDGSVLVVKESGYRRFTPKTLSKRERAKIKRLAKKPLTPARAAVHARVGAFFA